MNNFLEMISRKGAKDAKDAKEIRMILRKSLRALRALRCIRINFKICVILFGVILFAFSCENQIMYDHLDPLTREKVPGGDEPLVPGSFTYIVKYHANGGSGGMDDVVHTFDVPLALSENEFTHATLNFAGWNTMANGMGINYFPGQEVVNLLDAPGTFDLYAIWNNKVDPVVNWPTGLTAVYGQLLSSITLGANTGGTAGTFTWMNPGSAVGNAGVQSHSVLFTPSDPASYNSAMGTASVTVSALGITSAAVTVISPVLNQAPSAIASVASGNYTAGSVTWTLGGAPAGATFSADNQYTATVTLTANANYTFTGLATAAINGQTATVTNNTGTSVTLSYQFGPTSALTVKSIAVSTQPNLVYTHGDGLNLNNLNITITYNNDSTQTQSFLALGAFATASLPDDTTLSHSLHNNMQIVVTYGGQTAVTNSLTVNKKAITITGLTLPTRMYNGTTTIELSGGNLVGVEPGDIVTFTLGGGTIADKNAQMGKPVASTVIVLGGADANNYTLTQPTGLTVNITQAGLSITSASTTKPYDGTTNIAGGINVFLGGILGSDDVSPNVVTAVYTSENVGTKTVNITGVTLQGADAGNYAVSFLPLNNVNVIGGITESAVTITLQPTKLGITYGQTLSASTLTGGSAAVNGIPVNGTFAWENDLIVPPFGSSQQYIIFTPDNNNLASVRISTWVIISDPKQITIAGVQASNRAYNGTSTVALSGGVLQGLVGSDVVTFTLGNGTTADAFVENDKLVTTNIILTGADADKYTLTQPYVSVRIMGVELTIASATHTRPYNGTNMTNGTTEATGVTVTLAGHVGGDAAIVTANVLAAAYTSPNAGTTTLTITNMTLNGGTAAQNYYINTPVTVNVAGITQTYGTTVNPVDTNSVVMLSPTSANFNPLAALTNGQSVEYSLNTSGAPIGVTWQTSTVFTGLNSNQTYYIFVRSAENTNFEAGSAYGSGNFNFSTVTYNVNNGTGTPPATQAVVRTVNGTATNNTVTIPSSSGLTLAGSSFAGWNTAADGSGTNYSPGQTVQVPTSNLTLYARWIAAQSFTYTFVPPANFGETIQVTSGQTISKTSNGFASSTTLTIANVDASPVVEWFYGSQSLGTGNSVTIDATTGANFTLAGLHNITAWVYKDGEPHTVRIAITVVP